MTESAPPRRSPLRKVVFLGIGLVLATLLYFGWIHYRQSRILLATADADLTDAVAETDRLEPDGWRLDELETRRRFPPDEENAAFVAAAAWRLKPPAWPPLSTMVRPAADGRPATRKKEVPVRLFALPPPVAMDAELRADLTTQMEAVAPVVQAASRLRTLTHGGMPCPVPPLGRQVLSPVMWSSGMLFPLLEYEMYHRAEAGDLDGALEACEVLLGAGRIFGDEPNLYSLDYRHNAWEKTSRALQRVLAQGEPTAAALAAAQRALEEEAKVPLLAQRALSWRADFYRRAEALRTGQFVETGRGTIEFAGRIPIPVGPATRARHTHAEAVFLRLMNEAVAVARRPTAEQADAYADLLARAAALPPSDQHPFLGYALGGIQGAAELHRYHLSKMCCAAAALAAERFRREHGRWPTTVDELASKCVSDLLVDPEDGRPLSLTRHEEGIAFSARLLAKGKETFRLWDVPRRRQPPAPVGDRTP